MNNAHILYGGGSKNESFYSTEKYTNTESWRVTNKGGDTIAYKK